MGSPADAASGSGNRIGPPGRRFRAGRPWGPGRGPGCEARHVASRATSLDLSDRDRLLVIRLPRHSESTTAQPCPVDQLARESRFAPGTVRKLPGLIEQADPMKSPQTSAEDVKAGRTVPVEVMLDVMRAI
jgi:hypothetical protein